MVTQLVKRLQLSVTDINRCDITCFPVQSLCGLSIAGGSSLTLPGLSVSPLYTSSVYWSLVNIQPRIVILVPDTMWSWIRPAKGLPS